MRVLVVDDNDDIRLLVRTVLVMQDFEVDEARDGVEALAILRQADPPSAVLLDINIPAPDGMEVLATIRSEGLAVKVAIFSAHTDPQIERATLEAGADAFLVKPFTPTTLGETVERLVGPASP